MTSPDRAALADELDGLAQLLSKENTGSDAGFDDICLRAAAALRSPSPYSGADYSVWLVEVSEPDGPEYFKLSYDDEWTKDHDAALHFTRKQDAEHVIEHYGWTRAKAVEHMWPIAPSRDAERDANRKDAEEFCKGAFGPFVTDVSQYVQIVTELLEHASNRATGYCHNGNSPREEL